MQTTPALRQEAEKTLSVLCVIGASAVSCFSGKFTAEPQGTL